MCLLDADTTFFTVLGYSMSYIEFFGTLFNLASVWLVARRSLWTWPVGIVGVVLFGTLFYQLGLYSDVLEQGYFFATGLYGWFLWLKVRGDAATAVVVTRLSRPAFALWIAGVVAAGLSLGTLMTRIHEWLPRIFAEPAAYPYADALTTTMSFAAQILMAYRRLESWLLWIVVDVVGIWLYHARGVSFVALLYAAFLVLAVKGFFDWSRVAVRDDPVATAPNQEPVLQ